MAIGGGRLFGSFGSDSSRELGGPFNGSFGRGSLALELMIGGTPAPGLVIGGGLFIDAALGQPHASDLRINGRGADTLVLENAGIGLIGPFVDYYFDPKLGWHAQGSLGIAWMTLGRGTQGGIVATDDKAMGGLGFMIGGGYEWWIADQWSMGALLRLVFVSTESNKDDAERWSGKGLAFPEIMFTATYH
jgi:hypothetical protein